MAKTKLGLKLQLGLNSRDKQGTPWFLSEAYKANGYSPALFLDFVNLRYSANQAEVALASLIGFTRSFPTASRTKIDGYLESLLANAPILDYHPTTLEMRGLYLEPQIINYALNSEDLTNASWTATAVTVTNDAAQINPYGLLGASKVIPTATPGGHSIYASTSEGALGTGISGKIFAKAIGGYNLRVALNNSTDGDFGQVNVNLSTGAISGTPVGTDRVVTQRNDGWWEIDLHAIAAASKATRLFLYVLNGSFASSYTANGTSGVYLFGGQVSFGITNYIKTTGSKSTKAADVAVLTSSQPVPFADWFNPLEGTLIVEFEPNRVGGASAREVVSINDSSANEVIKVDFADSASDGIKVDIVDGGVNQFTSSIYNFTPGQSNYAVIAYKANNCLSAANEDLGGLDIAVTLPTVTRMVLGQQKGWLKRVIYFKHRLSDLEVIRVSSGEYVNG